MTDDEYRKNLAKSLNLPLNELHRLNSIVGKRELMIFLQESHFTPEIYEGTKDNCANVKNAVFRANFHIHTTESDGWMSIDELMELAAKYADKYAAHNNGKPAYIAITDHDNIQGNIKALKKIIKDPEKYKNLKVVLGMEFTSSFSSEYMKNPTDAHLLCYCVDPFKDEICTLNNIRINLYHTGFKDIYKKTCAQFEHFAKNRGFEYTYEDAIKIRPQLVQYPHNVENTIKDTTQFKYLFYALVLDNGAMRGFLKSNNLNPDSLDFTVPKMMIGKGEKRPYWKNYVDETRKYLLNELSRANPDFDKDYFNRIFGHLTPEDKQALEAMEYKCLNTFRPFWEAKCAPIPFARATQIMGKSENMICGIAHPAFTLRLEQDNPNLEPLAHDLINGFRKGLNRRNFIIEQYYPYGSDIRQKTIDTVYKAARMYDYIPSGARDSHRNSFFGRDDVFTKDELKELLKPVPKNNNLANMAKYHNARSR